MTGSWRGRWRTLAKPKALPSLTDEEIEIFRRSRTDTDLFTRYFFKKSGLDFSWNLDQNFDPDGAWQKTVHFSAQKRIVVIGGFGSGKTRGIAASACIWCATTRDFAFMNAAPQAWQSELMYKFIVNDLTQGTPFERLIFSKPKRPYPSVTLKFMIGSTIVTSTMEFMSVDENASAILSWEGDWVNIDEAGKLDDLGGTITNLGSRLRGQINGRDRLARLSMTTNSWDNPELWYRYDLAASLPQDYLSITVSSRSNHNVTEEQLKLWLKDIPEDEHERFIEGARPEGKGTYFSKEGVYAAEDQNYADAIIHAINTKQKGYAIETVKLVGVSFFQLPAQESHNYVLIGDPGSDNAPNRNAPCLMVWDVTDFPKFKANLVAFWWGAGHGSLKPFVRTLLRFMAEYNPIFSAVDSTGPQKGTAELLNTYVQSKRMTPEKVEAWLGPIDLSRVLNPMIGGMDFSSGRKDMFLISGKLMLDANLLIWPKFVNGIRSQLTNYDREKDTSGMPKFPQDIVSAFCMSTYALRALFPFDIKSRDPKETGTVVDFNDLLSGRDSRLASVDRELREAR